MSRLITNLSSNNITLLSSDTNENLNLFNLNGNVAVNGPDGIYILNATGPQGDTGPQGPEGGNAAFVLRWNYEGTGPLTQNGYFITNSTDITEINQFRFAYLAFGPTVSEYLFNQLSEWVINQNNSALISFIDETQPSLYGTYLVNNLNYTGAVGPSPDSYIVNVSPQTSSGGFLNINDQCLFSIAFIGPTGSQGPTGPNPYLDYSLSSTLTGSNYPDLYSDPGDFDFYQLDTTNNPIDITLPLISTLNNGKRIHIFSDVGGNLSTNNVILNATGGNVIGNSTSLTMNIDYSSIQIASNGSNRWIIF